MGTRSTEALSWSMAPSVLILFNDLSILILLGGEWQQRTGMAFSEPTMAGSPLYKRR